MTETVTIVTTSYVHVRNVFGCQLWGGAETTSVFSACVKETGNAIVWPFNTFWCNVQFPQSP